MVGRQTRFSLYTMLLVTGILAYLLAVHTNRAWRQRSVFKLACELGGSVRYDYEPREPGWPSVWMAYPLLYAQSNRPEPWGPHWAHKWIGKEYFSRIVAVEFSSSTLKPQFAVEHEIEKLSLEDFQDNSAIKKGPCSLRVLSSLEKRKVKELCSLGEIEHIRFSYVLVDESVLAILSECQSLKSVSISPVGFGDDDLQQLANCGNLGCVELFEGNCVMNHQVNYAITPDGPKRLVHSLPGCTVYVTEIDAYGFPKQFPKVIAGAESGK